MQQANQQARQVCTPLLVSLQFAPYFCCRSSCCAEGICTAAVLVQVVRGIKLSLRVSHICCDVWAD
jgi:hypothetical protein